MSDMADDPDHRGPLIVVVEAHTRDEAFAERVLAGPRDARHRLVDDGDIGRRANCCTIAEPNESDPDHGKRSRRPAPSRSPPTSSSISRAPSTRNVARALL